MNILALTSVYPQPDDGTEVVTPTVEYFCQKWSEAGHRVIVIHCNSCFPALFYAIPDNFRAKLSSKFGHNLPTKASRKPLSRESKGVKVYRLPMTKIIPHKKFGHSAIQKQVRKIKAILEAGNFQPDCIISHWLNPQLQLILELKKIYSAKTSLVFHGDCGAKQIQDYDLIHSIKELDAVGCRNESYAKKVFKSLHLPKMPFLCYSGVPDEMADSQFKHIERLEERNKHEFLYVGRLVKYKNVDVIIKALHTLYPEGNFVFHIVGVGAEHDKLAALTKEYHMQEQVIFHGQMPRNDVFALMKKASCFIMVSDNETFGMVYIEAMLAGCITIASKNGGVDGVIIHGNNGFLSKQGDTESLVSVLSQIESLDMAHVNQIRKNAIMTAYDYRDSEVANHYLKEVFNWKG